MLDTSPELLALFASSTLFWMADCFTITPAFGMPAPPAPQSLYYNNSPFSFQMQGGDGFPTFQAWQIRCSNITDSPGVAVGECDLICNPGPDDLIGTVDWMTAAAVNGQLDGAEVVIQQAFFTKDSMPYPVGAIPIFKGNIADQDPFSAMTAQFKVKNLFEKLNHNWPRNLYGPSCHWRLYSTPCGVNRAAYTVSNALTAGSTRNSFNCTLSQAAGYFNLGVIAFTSGANAGARRTVKSSAPGVVTVALPLLHDVAIGDAFDIYPGCDLAQATCSSKFANTNYKATPNVPAAEVAA